MVETVLKFVIPSVALVFAAGAFKGMFSSILESHGRRIENLERDMKTRQTIPACAEYRAAQEKDKNRTEEHLVRIEDKIDQVRDQIITFLSGKK